MNVLDLVLRWMHIFSAVALAGGLVFLAFVWAPANAGLDGAVREERFSALRKLWARIVMLTTLLLLVSGFVNFVSIVKHHEKLGGLYHAMFGLKFLLAMIVFFFSARISGRSESAVKMREKLAYWTKLTAILALLVVGMGSVMKMVPHIPKAVDANSPVVPIDDGSDSTN